MGLLKKTKQATENLIEGPEQSLDNAGRRKEKKGIHLHNSTTGDLGVVLLVALLTIFGIVMVFSASYYYAMSNYGSPYHYLIRQAIWVAGGFGLMIFFSLVNYRWYTSLWFGSYMVGLVLLALVFTPLGGSAGGATRWLRVGPITVMPGELCKIFLIIAVAGYFSKYPKMGDKWKGVLTVVGAAGAYAFLIMKQPNMSTAATVCLIAGGMLLVAGIKWSQVIVLGGGAVFAGIALIISDDDGYRYQRFLSFLDPFADAQGNGYNVVQSLLALGTGGFTGLGLGNSVEKTLYLPMPQNDFILAIIGEELGFIGLVCLMMVYMLLIWRGLRIAMNAEDYTGMMLATGITVMVGVQVIINVAVVTSSMPPTGITLPFISYGGNAMLLFMSAMGMLLNVSKHQKSDKE